ncbi:GtrA family protein [Halocynthiibacter halioticoli]|uniref:GtrA family protein n=1 Tax=Halocynthiibacter TaxID=1579315 RepID=UPI0037447BF2
MIFGSVSGEALRFVGVGAANSALYFLCAATLNSLLGLNTITASVIAYAFAAVFAYLGHKHLTFRNVGAAPFEACRFAAATFMGLVLSLIIPVLLYRFAPVVSFLSVLIVIPLCSFIMMKFFVFRT